MLLTVSALNSWCVLSKPLHLLLMITLEIFFSFRWQLPDAENSVQASTANELRRDKHTFINPEKLKAAAVGMTQSKTKSLHI